MSSDSKIALLMQEFRCGQLVRARNRIVFCSDGFEVGAGCLGTVHAVKVHGCTPLVVVEWHSTAAHKWVVCSVENLEPASN